jgi:uncharacterized OB-fold protein
VAPVPVPDEQSGAFWAATAEGRLVIARCGRCGTFAHPPDLVCPSCGSTDAEYAFEPVSGRGTVRSWTVVRQAFLPGFESDLPFVLVDVALDEDDDVRLIGRLVDGPAASLALGDRVTTTFDSLADGFAVPAFALDPTP